jgi:hypothetical protein
MKVLHQSIEENLLIWTIYAAKTGLELCDCEMRNVEGKGSCNFRF